MLQTVNQYSFSTGYIHLDYKQWKKKQKENKNKNKAME